MPASKLKAYLETETPRIARESGHVQKPEVVNGFPTDNEPVFGNARPDVNVEITFTDTHKNRIILEGPDAREVESGDASTGPWRMKLSNGLHVLREEGTENEKVLRIRSGEEVLHVIF